MGNVDLRLKTMSLYRRPFLTCFHFADCLFRSLFARPITTFPLMVQVRVMPIDTLRIPFLSFVATLLILNCGHAEDWSQYRGPAGDGKSSESIGDLNWRDAGPREVWKVPVSEGFSSFAVAGGRAFTIVKRDSIETLVALDAETGRERWTAKLGASEYGHDGGNSGAPGNRGGDGPRSTPSVDENHVYVYDSHMVLSCFDATTGQVKWQHDIPNDFAGRNMKWLNATSPLLDGDRVYVGGGGPNQAFIAFNRETGDLIWKSGDEMITHATPHVTTVDGKKQVIFFTQSGLVSVDASTGQEIWRGEFPFSVSTAASPVSEGNQVYCSAGYGVGAGLFQINGSPRAEEVWFKSNELMNHWSTPVVHDGHLYGIFEFKKYGKAPLQCVELATGEIKWSERGFGPGNCIKVGDKLVVLSDAGEVAVVEARSDAYRELGRAKVIDGKCWSTPAFSDGRLYIRSTQQAACLELP